MAYHDSNPERRNLIMLSLCIIIFYLAGGSFSSSEVRLQVINVAFSEPKVLVLFVWGLLVWFCYRYWLVYQGSWKKEYCIEIVNSNMLTGIYYGYLKKRFGLGDDYPKSYHKDRHWLKISSRGPEGFVFQHIYKEEDERQKSDTIDISSLKDKLVILLCSSVLSLTKPTLSTYFVPYILFVLAITLGFKHWL